MQAHSANITELLTIYGELVNFVGKFEPSHLGSSSVEGSTLLSGKHVDIGTHSHNGLSDTVTIPNAHLLFSGDYERSGTDLIVSDQDHRVVVHDYFRGEKRPTLVSSEGAPLDAKVIEALTGHTAYAQAGGAVSAAKVIGHVVKISGSASVVRNGVAIELNNGDNINQGDVAQTGSNSTLGLVLIDGTTFNLSANARLMLNDMVYDPNGTSNSSLLTLVQGAAGFVAGQVAKTGDMKVATPVATMGIRGTAVTLDIDSVDGKVRISVVDQHDNIVHAVEVRDRNGNLIGTVTSNGTTLTLTPTATFAVIAQQSNKSVADVAQEFNAFQSLLSTYDLGKQLVPSTPPPSDGKRGDANPQSTPTKLGSATILPSNAPSTTVFQPDKTASTTTSTDNGSPTQPNSTVTPPPTTPVIITQNGGTTPVDVPATPLPFVVTPATFTKVSSGPGDHFGPVMSADGHFVTYDPDGAIYLYDRQTDTTITIASPTEGMTYGSPTISADGHTIVYQGTDGTHNYVFIYDNNPSDQNYGHTTQLGAGGAPAVSGDGSRIVVENGSGGIVLYDQQGHVLATITPAAIAAIVAAGGGSAGSLGKPAISADGHIIAFWNADPTTPGQGTSPGELLVYNLATGTITEIAKTTHVDGAHAASFSADGRYVVFESDAALAGTDGAHSEIYLYDLTTRQIVFHTDNAAGGSYHPVISPDGHYVIFASDAKLTADDTNSVADMYVVDLTHLSNPVYKLVSVLADGTLGNAASNLGGTISAGGLYVAFGSDASNFATGDTNGGGDIFVVDPTSGHSAVIQETANSPSILTTGGTIALTGETNGITVSVSDPTGRFTAGFDANHNIQWTFNEAKSDFAFLNPGEFSVQDFVITLTSGTSTTTIPVKVTVFDADLPPVVVADVAPVAAPVTLAQGQEDTPYTITTAALLAGVTDIDSTSLTITSLSVHSGGGTLHDNGDGTWTYTPAANDHGPVTFDYTASDGTLTAASTASLEIASVNDAPVAHDDVLPLAAPLGDGWVLDADNGHYYRLVTTNVSWDDANAAAQSDGAYLATITSQAEQNFVGPLAAGNRAWLGGESTDDLSFGSNHFFWMTGPEAGAAFGYTHWVPGEPNGGFGTTEYVHIEGVSDPVNLGWNDAPGVNNGRDFIEEWGGRPSDANVGEDSTLTISAATLLANDTDVDHDVLSIKSVAPTSAHGAAVSVSANGDVVYDPTNAHDVQALAAGQTLTDTFTYTVDDGHGGSSTATVQLVVAGINDAPAFTGVAAGATFEANGAAVAIATGVSASDIDSVSFNGGSLTATVTDGGHEGDTLSIATTQTIRLDGKNVMFDSDGEGEGNAVTIGTLTDNINSLTVALNNNATDTAVAALTQAIQFQNTIPNPIAGPRTVTFTLKDGGGIANGGQDSTSFDATVTILDTTAPTGGTPDLAAASDSGASHCDDLTNVTAPTFTVALDPSVAVGDTVKLVMGDWTLASHIITAGDISAHSVSLTLTDGALGEDSTKYVSAEFSDAAGNTSTTSALEVILDTTPPHLTIDNVSGTTTNQTHQTICGMADSGPGSAVAVYDNGNFIGNAYVGSDGSWHKSVTLSVDGPHSIVAHETDAAGNLGSSNTVVFTLDTTPPHLTIDNVSGTTTNQTHQTISGTADSGPGSAVAVYDNGNFVGNAYVGSDGSWHKSVTLSVDGGHSIVAQEADALGNLGSATVVFTLDTIAPDAPTLALAHDTGVSDHDTITNDSTITYTPSATGDTLLYKLDGAEGFSTGAPVITTDGQHTVMVEERDAAGNVSSTASLTFTLDTTEPTVAIYGSGGLTEAHVTISGSAENAADTVALYDNGVLLNADVTLSGGQWTADVTLSGDGEHHIVAHETDTAGNTGLSNAVVFTLDHAPVVSATAPSTTLVEASGSDPGVATSFVTITTSDPDAGDTVSYDTTGWSYASNYAYVTFGDGEAHSWTQARADALASGRYLVNITSAAENTLVNNLVLAGHGYLAYTGGTDAAHEGSFVWADGPEAGQAIGYTNWASGEPSNGGNPGNNPGEDYIVTVSDGNRPATTGQWNDVPDVYGAAGYVVEFDTFSRQGTYGYAVLDPSTGQLTYHLDNNDPDTQALTAGQHVTDAFDIVVKDSEGATATKHVVFDVTAANVAPSITGDLSVVAVKGGSMAVTTADLNVVDPDALSGELTFTLGSTSHGTLWNSHTGSQLSSTGGHFTLADIANGYIYFATDNSFYVGQGGFTVSVSDGIANTPAMTAVGVTIVDAQITVQTAGGYDFDQDNPIAAMGLGNIDPTSKMSQSFHIVNASADREFIIVGAFNYDGAVPAGTITSIQEVIHSTQASLARFDLDVDATAWLNAATAYSNGNHGPMEAMTGSWTFNFIGSTGSDGYTAGSFNDLFTGRGGNDLLDGDFGYDRASYGAATGAINVQLAAGTVDGDGSVGHDTLRSIELVTGSNFADTFNAAGFSATSQNAGSTVTNNTGGLFNEFEGRGGNDIITGNGQTRVSYYHATSGVTVTFDEGTWNSTTGGASGHSTGDASVGNDTFSGVNQVRGSFFNDTFNGSTNPYGTGENFEGLGGNDTINGGGGFDRANYFQSGSGITVNLAAGTVIGGPDTGTDTLRSVEAIWGTEFNDTYDATGFSQTSTNAGSAQRSATDSSASDFNEFEGGGGHDTITGNGNTRIAYYHATGGVVVTLGDNVSVHGTAVGASTGVDDIVSGVSRVRGSEFNDIITGNDLNNTLEGQGGNDVLDGHGGNDFLTGGTGSDIFVYESGGGNDRITDFNRSEGDRIDLRLAGINGIGNLGIIAGTFDPSNNSFTAGAGGPDTRLTGFGTDNTITVLGVAPGSFSASDFIFTGEVAVTVQTPNGYDFGTLYDDLAASNAHQTANDNTHIFAVDTTKGITFELIGTGFDLDPTSHLPTGGTITEIDILDTTDPTQTTQDHVLVNTNGWSISVTPFFNAIGLYAADHSHTSNLDAIFNAATYSVVGSDGGTASDGNFSDGTDVFFGGVHADVFNGMPGSFGSQDPGNDTVDYSHAQSGVTANLLTGVGTGGAANGDIYISIENLRGTASNDTLTGDGNNNVLEGGAGADALSGGGGTDTASYEHAAAVSGQTGVTVSLLSPGSNTGEAAGDTYSSIENLRGSAFDDILTGDGNNNMLEGGPGNDTLNGGAGNNTASYEHATAGVTVNLNAAGAQITIGAGTDTLTNIQNLTGSQFNDTLTGDANDNTFFGLGGNDTFVFKQGFGHDTIADLTPGRDHIEFDFDPTAFGGGNPGTFDMWLSSHAQASLSNANDTLIKLDDLSQSSILLKNVNVANLHASDFIVPH
jgi:VCBS repeat-containing protein